MAWFSKSSNSELLGSVAVAEPPVQQPEVEAVQQAVIEEDEKPLPFGAKVGNLVQFGDAWVDMAEVVGIDLDPHDGCGAEIELRNGSTMHISKGSTDALQSYLTGMVSASKAVDEQ